MTNNFSSSAEIISIQYLRGVAALLVVLHHARNPNDWLFNPLASFTGGESGVDVFFVISGFVMAIAATKESFRDFAIRRVIRVVPLYWIITGLFISLRVIASPAEMEPLTIQHLVKSLLFIPHFSPIYPGNIWPALVPGWTLNFEMFFYLLFALGIIVGRPILLVCAVVPLLVLAGFIGDFRDPIIVTYTSPLLFEFILGVVLGVIFKRNGVPAIIGWLTPAAIVLLLFPDLISQENQIACRISGATVLVAAALSLEPRVKKLPLRALKMLGDISYSLYLTHLIALAVASNIFRRLPINDWLQFTLYLAFALLGSCLLGYLTHRFVEKPLTQHLRRTFQKASTALPEGAK